MNSIANLLILNILFDVDGKRFFLLDNAIKHFEENNSKEINALNFFIGWHQISKR